MSVAQKAWARKNSWRAFEILNLGKYERQHYIGINPCLRESEKQQLEAKEQAFLVPTLLRGNAYGAYH